jgi:DNA recombination protein RmuC
VYSFIHQHEPGIIDTALAQKVVLCSPCTLFPVLAVIRQSVESFLVEQTSSEILDCLAGFTHQWEQFTDKIEMVGKRLESTRTAYEELNGPRRRQLERQLDRVDDLRTRHELDADPAKGQGGGWEASVA